MEISRHSFIFGLSYALDIAGRNNLSHSKSTAYLSILIAREIGISEDLGLGVYYAALLHDIGVSDEYVFGIPPGTDMKKHCVIGEEILKKLPFSDEIHAYVLYHHEFCNGSGPFGLSEAAIPKGAQIICFASAFDDYFGKANRYNRDLFLKIREWLGRVSPLFSKDIIDAFHRLIEREYFLLDYFSHETKFALSSKVIVSDGLFYGSGDIKQISQCFADIIDQRSPFTFNHSTGIAGLARTVAAHLGYDEETQDKMYIAGLLHDLGKLYVLTGILHKNGALTPEERFEINKHTYFTRRILEQIEGFEDIVDLAANHHEKLDGTGYPYKLDEGHLGELERVMAICDVYQALTEERPYREKMHLKKVWEIIDGMAENRHLDKLLTEKFRQIIA